nr:hypothetical protein CFP56_53036 [Quercus suber]
MVHGVLTTASCYSGDGEKGMTAFFVNFSHIPIWVQVWGLLFDLINEEAGRDIGSGIGRIVTVDCKAISFDQARFLRVQVEMPLDKPIQRGACTGQGIEYGSPFNTNDSWDYVSTVDS